MRENDTGFHQTSIAALVAVSDLLQTGRHSRIIAGNYLQCHHVRQELDEKLPNVTGICIFHALPPDAQHLLQLTGSSRDLSLAVAANERPHNEDIGYCVLFS
jgi:hypothetical protein